MQDLETRLDSSRVVCDANATARYESTDWSSIVYLNQHNVECMDGSFLASFHLKTEAYVDRLGRKLHRVTYHYDCCKFIL